MVGDYLDCTDPTNGPQPEFSKLVSLEHMDPLGSGTNMEQLYKLLETPNRFLVLADCESAQGETHITDCKASLVNSGPSEFEGVFVDKNRLVNRRDYSRC